MENAWHIFDPIPIVFSSAGKRYVDAAPRFYLVFESQIDV